MRKASMVFLVLLVGCIPYFSRVYDVGQINSLEAILEPIEITGYQGERTDLTKRKAISFHIGDGYYVALSHAACIPKFFVMRTPFGIIQTPIKVRQEQFYMNGKMVKLVGRHEDISVFYAEHLKDKPFLPWGDSDKLERSTKVYTVGYSYTKMYNFKDGIISETDIPKGIFVPQAVNCFMMTLPANPGDSGSPVVAINTKTHKGGLEIVGIVCATIRDKGMSFAFKSNYVQECIAKILK